jgi:purine-nucleoside phosphorylase
MAAPNGLQPTAALSERVLLPGDPGRALMLAEALLERPKMFNHHRGLWGYTGVAPDGAPVTIQSTGIGGPSAAIVIHEGPIVTTDVFYDGRELERGWSAAGALAVEMEAATLFALAAARGVQGAALLVVCDLVLPTRVRIDRDDLRAAERRMGEAALRALVGGGAGAHP